MAKVKKMQLKPRGLKSSTHERLVGMNFFLFGFTTSSPCETDTPFFYVHADYFCCLPTWNDSFVLYIRENSLGSCLFFS